MFDYLLLKAEFNSELADSRSLLQLDTLRIKYLGKNGIITSGLKKLKELAPTDKITLGNQLNELKIDLNNLIIEKKNIINDDQINQRLKQETIDLSQPPRPKKQGKIHPISQVIQETIAIFASMGFAVEEGPDIENEFYNFTALNIPKDHPARQMHDTFYLADQVNLLRTHTSPVQIRTMQQQSSPLRVICPGRVYRCDWDITHTPMFHQLEGLVIEDNINLTHLKGCILEFLTKFFEFKDLAIRFRPSFFPFTEPSIEVDIGYSKQDKAIRLDKPQSWLEVMGCGIISQQVFRQVKLDNKMGFAFGFGLERLAMLKYGISDLRLFFENDVKWLNHYGFSAFNIPSLLGGLSK